MSLELYNIFISVLQNFGFSFRPPLKLPNFAKVGRNFEPWLLPTATCCFGISLASQDSTTPRPFDHDS